jgi:hypothetical protein
MMHPQTAKIMDPYQYIDEVIGVLALTSVESKPAINSNTSAIFSNIRLYIKRMAVFCVVQLCSLLEFYQHFRGICCLHYQNIITLLMEATGTSETLVNFYQTTWQYNPAATFLLATMRTSYPTSYNEYNVSYRKGFLLDVMLCM